MNPDHIDWASWENLKGSYPKPDVEEHVRNRGWWRWKKAKKQVAISLHKDMPTWDYVYMEEYFNGKQRFKFLPCTKANLDEKLAWLTKK